MEAQLLRQQLASSSRMSLKPDPTARVDDQGDVDDEEADDRDGIPEPARRVGYGNYQQRTLNMNNIRRLRNNFRKRNYNLDHLARMNFRRSFRASSFNNRHILGGL